MIKLVKILFNQVDLICRTDELFTCVHVTVGQMGTGRGGESMIEVPSKFFFTFLNSFFNIESDKTCF